MRIITLVTQKGGSGKTTLAACLAVAASEAGERAIALDLDPQQSLWKWGEERKADAPAVDRLDPTQLTQLSAIVKALDEQGFTLAILDTAGVASTATHLAMQVSDLCLIPARPSRIDIQATWSTVDALKRMDRQFAFVLNQCPTNVAQSQGRGGERRFADARRACRAAAHAACGVSRRHRCGSRGHGICAARKSGGGNPHAVEVGGQTHEEGKRA